MPSCFVIMPFGQKQDLAPGGKIINFDRIYDDVIEPSVKSVGLDCTRCDKIEKPGLIHNTMLKHIHHSDVAVVDITTLNPNVFYELGVRHSLVGRVTVLIKRAGTAIPFNINGLNAIEYPAELGGGDPVAQEIIDETKRAIASFITNGLEELETDSLVYANLPTLPVPEERKIITASKRYTAPLAKPGRQIGIITGDIRDVRGVDVWVSSENTNMQMARFYEKSISGTIRYYGAKREGGSVTNDILANELAAALNGKMYVDAGEVMSTSAGELTASNGVRRIFHAAAVQGQIGFGFRPIHDVSVCVKQALKLADAESKKGPPLRSILFPLMGTGQGGGKLLETTASLVTTAKSYLEGTPGSAVKQLYFLCWTERDLAACQWAFKKAGLSLKASK